MTAQRAEILWYDGKEVEMFAEPLEHYFWSGKKRPDFEVGTTSCSRRYVGTWKIVNDRLYLIAITANLRDGSEASLKDVFPRNSVRVFASWYSDKVRIPEGKLLHYVHAGYASIYERERVLTIENGTVVRNKLKVNKTQ